MRRAIVLIVVMLVLSVSLGLWMDFSQQAVAREYLEASTGIRALLTSGQVENALHEQAYWHAKWQHDAKWLNCLVSHHHTRAVTTAMVELATALEQNWNDEALRALNKLDDALGDVEQSDFPALENIF